MTNLPISEKEEFIIGTLLENQVIILEGETGSGKTTQMPIFLYEAGFAQKGTIGITQPRRFAVTSVANYVAQLSGKPMGDIVGYQVRFNQSSDENTAVKFMTAGILLLELQNDRELSRYSVIMVDEAHERTAEMDLLLGLLKGVIQRRKNLRLIIASATIDTQKFSKYFGNAPIVKVSGRTYPVEIRYLPSSIDDSENFIDQVAQKVVEVQNSTLLGHILVFLPGKQDIHEAIEAINKLSSGKLMVLPLYGGMEPSEQERVFKNYAGLRKVIVSTNIAETSVTVDGIAYVVDAGFVKESDFNSDNGLAGLDVIKHSKAGCDQRAGRAGRTRSGICYRMYTEADYAERRSFTQPEIQRISLMSTLLTMARLGISKAEAFDFIDAPDSKIIRSSYESLIILGALDQRRKITQLGLQMATLPFDPIVSKMVLDSCKAGCVKEMITIAAFLSVPNVLLRPKGLEALAWKEQRMFFHSQSDLLQHLNIWKEYKAAGYDRKWCKEHFLSHRALWEISEVRADLKKRLIKAGVNTERSGNQDVLLRCIVQSLKFNILEYRPKQGYCSLFQNVQKVSVQQGSVLHGSKHPYITSTQLVEVKNLRIARNCTIVRPGLIAELFPHLAQKKKKKDSFTKLVFEKKGTSLVSVFEGKPIQASLRNKVEVKPGIPYTCKIITIGEAVFAEAQSL